jgi:ABC-type nickel/cobalt efflux system permease component RcnA
MNGTHLSNSSFSWLKSTSTTNAGSMMARILSAYRVVVAVVARVVRRTGLVRARSFRIQLHAAAWAAAGRSGGTYQLVGGLRAVVGGVDDQQHGALLLVGEPARTHAGEHSRATHTRHTHTHTHAHAHAHTHTHTHTHTSQLPPCARGEDTYDDELANGRGVNANYLWSLLSMTVAYFFSYFLKSL